MTPTERVLAALQVATPSGAGPRFVKLGRTHTAQNDSAPARGDGTRR